MAPRQGLSAEAKQKKMLELFHETKDVFNLKELEKVAPKSKGIIQQAVKETLLLLVSDGLVQSDKVGSGQYYWSFPSQKGVHVKNGHSTKMNELAKLQAQCDQSENELAAEQGGREDTAKRQQLLADYELQRIRNEELNQSLGKLSDANPAVFKKRSDDVMAMREGSVFWTDAVSCLISYVRDRSGNSSDEIRKQFDIHEDFEDLIWLAFTVEASHVESTPAKALSHSIQHTQYEAHVASQASPSVSIKEEPAAVKLEEEPAMIKLEDFDDLTAPKPEEFEESASLKLEDFEESASIKFEESQEGDGAAIDLDAMFK